MSINDKIFSLESFAEITAKFNSTHNKQFRELILNFLISEKYAHKDLNKLNKLHDFIIDKSLMVIENEIEQGRVSYGLSELSKNFYSLVDSHEFGLVYIDLLLYLHKVFGIDFYFQSSPTIRVHFPNADSRKSYPIFHTDGATGHPPSEVNIWMPMTDNKESTFSIMSYRDSLEILQKINFDYDVLNEKTYTDDDFNNFCLTKSTSIDGKEGICDDSSFYVFNSLRLHSTLPPERETRISIDMRILPVENFDRIKEYKGGGRMGAEFWPGGRYGYDKHSIAHYLS